MSVSVTVRNPDSTKVVGNFQDESSLEIYLDTANKIVNDYIVIEAQGSGGELQEIIFDSFPLIPKTITSLEVIYNAN